jgi:hypothetical protein
MLRQLNREKKSIYNKMVQGPLDIHMKKIAVGTLPHAICKRNTQPIRELHIRSKTIKLLGDNRNKYS